MSTYEVQVCLRVTLTVTLQASSAADAEDMAHDAATEVVAGMGLRTAHYGVVAKEDDRTIHAIEAVA